MNDRYLFRAKRTDNGEWVEGYYCKWKQIRRTICIAEEKIVDCIIVWMSDGSMLRYEIDPDTLCQYTGLTDKNGMKIWENDILKCGVNSVVVWNKKYASWCLRKKRWLYDQFFGDSVEPEDVEVVGNTFDNPELLEVR